MNGRSGTNRHNYRYRDNEKWPENTPRQGKKNPSAPRYDKNDGLIFERPRWTPPKMSAEPFPVPVCPYCGKPIRDLASAFSDKNSGEAVHFDCVLARISEGEILEKGDSVVYIGGGRFGIVCFDSAENTQHFIIKKIFEWEDKENRASWRSLICDHYSVT
ncbi:MAG: hypothetical protein LBT93_03025 [Treponema sp.]|nr:hypothetical protein [Treponema sp.]